MRQFDKEGPRADGEPVVWAGSETGPALVVLDPAGAARHEDLPATWHPIAARFQVAWCRLPASRDSVEDVEDVLETLAERQSPTNLVASGQACQAALAIAAQFADLVQTVLLIDPPPGAGPAVPDSVEVRVVASSHAGTTDRVPPPLPLGHPEVVAGIVAALATMR